MRLMIISGEASGDLHGSGVVKELKKLDKDIDIFGIGGNKMQAAGMELVYHSKELSVMGFVEVLKKLPVIRSVEKTLETLLQKRRPDALLLIDYPGFNLRFAKKAHKLGIKIFYYISPQIWAWHRSRIKQIKNLITKMFVVLPFEIDIYRKAQVDVEFVGHPLLDVIGTPQARPEFCARYGLDKSKPIIGLFPGSRKQELDNIFPTMLQAVEELRTKFNAEIVVGAASALEGDYIKSFLDENTGVRIIQNATYDLMKNSDVAVVTSGTATLETACFQTPMVIVYKTSWLTYLIGRLLVHIKHIGLVNILAGKTIVPELIQHKANAYRIAKEAGKYLADKAYCENTRQELSVIFKKLGQPGAASRVAEKILNAPRD
jgi:lipid-A-disaccharide synthase